MKVDCATFGDGVFDDTDVGTLFFDPIEAMSVPMQARLSLFLEQQVIRRTSHAGTGQARVVSGSNGRVTGRMEANRFSTTLFYRLNVIHMQASELLMAVPT